MTTLKRIVLAAAFGVSPHLIFGSGRLARVLRRFLLSNNSPSSALTVSADLGSPLVDEAIASGITVLRKQARSRHENLRVIAPSPQFHEDIELYLARLRAGV